MMTYEIEGRSGRRIAYRYSVEGREEDSGRAVVTLTDDGRDVEGIEVTEPAPTDRAVGYGWYAGKLVHAARSSIASGSWRAEGVVAWY